MHEFQWKHCIEYILAAFNRRVCMHIYEHTVHIVAHAHARESEPAATRSCGHHTDKDCDWRKRAARALVDSTALEQRHPRGGSIPALSCNLVFSI